MTFGIFNKKLACIATICTAFGFTSILVATPNTKPNINPLETAINNVLHLESSWNTVLRIDPRPERPISVLIPYRDQLFTLELETHSTRSDVYQVLKQDDEGLLYEVPAGPVRTMRGTILELPGSVAAGSLMDDGLYVRIRVGNGDEFWMEPVGEKLDGNHSNLYAFYNTSDVIPNGGTCAACAADDYVDVGKILEMLARDNSNESLRGTVICTAQLGVDTDYEYYQQWGSGTESRINQVVNSINLQYEDEVNLTHAITTIIVRDDSNDPYTSTDAGTLLEQFANEWNQNQGQIQRDLAHLFTGKNLNSGTIGVAWLGVVCWTNSAYGLAQSDCCGSFACTTDLSAHEMGHNWDAGHVNSPAYQTMYPSIQCANQFVSSSIAAITSFADSVNCLSCENQAPLGACCVGTTCIEIYQINCEGGGGDWQGDNTTCTSSSCIPPTGACCVNGTCYVYDESACDSAGGSYAGDNTDCGSVGCTIGACCIGIDCSLTLQADCAGSWYGDNSSCADVSCGAGADELNYVLAEWSRSDQQEMNTLDVFFPSTDPNTRMTAVFGQETDQDSDLLQIRAWSNNFFDGSATQVALHHSIYGGDFAHDRALDDALGIDLVYDSYVTIGTDDGADGTPNALGFDSDGFNSSDGMYMDNGIWFVLPDSPLASIGAGTGNGHRIASLSVEAGQGIELLVNVAWFDGADVSHETRNIYWNNEGIGDGGDDCATDINGSGATDVTDLLEVIGAWGACSGCAADIDGNGQVDVSDLLEVIGAWGPCP